MPISEKDITAADQIREEHARAVDRIRNRTDLNTEGKIGRIAQVHTAARDAMAELQQSSEADTAAKQRTFERAAFGIADLPGDQAMNATSFRDAQDRVARIDNPADAAAMLDRAERAGDEPLARAVAGHCYDQSNTGLGRMSPGWSEVLGTFLAARPDKAEKAQQLNQSKVAFGDMRGHFAFVLSTPSEIASVPAAMLAQYADNARTGR